MTAKEKAVAKRLRKQTRNLILVAKGGLLLHKEKKDA